MYSFMTLRQRLVVLRSGVRRKRNADASARSPVLDRRICPFPCVPDMALLPFAPPTGCACRTCILPRARSPAMTLANSLALTCWRRFALPRAPPAGGSLRGGGPGEALPRLTGCPLSRGGEGTRESLGETASAVSTAAAPRARRRAPRAARRRQGRARSATTACHAPPAAPPTCMARRCAMAPTRAPM